MLLHAAKPISFGEFKTKMKMLEDEQLELIKALEKTTRNLSVAIKTVHIFTAKLKETMSDREIDGLLIKGFGDGEDQDISA